MARSVSISPSISASCCLACEHATVCVGAGRVPRVTHCDINAPTAAARTNACTLVTGTSGVGTGCGLRRLDDSGNLFADLQDAVDVIAMQRLQPEVAARCMLRVARTAPSCLRHEGCCMLFVVSARSRSHVLRLSHPATQTHKQAPTQAQAQARTNMQRARTHAAQGVRTARNFALSSSD